MEKVTEDTPIPGTSMKFRYKAYTWFRSPRVNGKLQLRSNIHTRTDGNVISYRKTGTAARFAYGARYSAADLFPQEVDRVRAALYNKAYASFRKKLYQGNASLGVTLGSYRQSREMVVKRAQQISRQADHVAADIMLGLTPRKIASAHLETIFGWIPLVQDIFSATYTVIQQSDRLEFVKSRATGYLSIPYQGPTWGTWNNARGTDGAVRVTLSARVRITNPNRWLLERAGLLNPLAVAWDLVPWSFVINMFVNTGQLVNSVTDFAGLTFDGGLRTDAIDALNSAYIGYYPGDHTLCQWIEHSKTQRATSFPSPRLTLKVPDANWELAAMATSLMVQKSLPVLRYVHKHNLTRTQRVRSKRRGPEVNQPKERVRNASSN